MKQTIKTICLGLLCAATCWWLSSCRNSQKTEKVQEETCSGIHDGHDHDAHSHEGHDAHDHDAHSHEGHDHDAHGHEAEEAASGTPDEIVMTEEKAAAAGVHAEKIMPGPFRGVLAVSGRIMPASGNLVSVVASVPGIVSFSAPLTEGSRVGKGSTLFTISSSNLQDGDPAERARIEYETAKAEYERASSLVKDNIVSRQEFEAAKNRYETARLAYAALAADKDARGTAVKSPAAGHIRNCLVSEGDYVSVGTPLASVILDGKMYLKADVSERHLAFLEGVEDANFRLSYGDSVFSISDMKGRLMGYGRSTDDTNAYIPVTFEFNGNSGILPGAYAQVWLLSGERKDVISLPAEAITEEQGHHFIYIRTDPTCYRKQEVHLGASDGKRFEVISGLNGGEEVVTAGAIHVKLASASNAIPAHSHNH